MVMITGPRQVGKTTLAKQIMAEFKKPQYLNADAADDRRIILDRGWPLDTDLLVFDEIHKMKDWKPYLKGVFDTRPENQAVLLSGSARLETFRQTGESLAGRYFHLRLHPFSVKELSGLMPAEDALAKLDRRGGFPEPFLADSEEDAARWRAQYYTDIVREDIFDISRVHEVRDMRLLLELLRSRTGSPLSFSALAEDLQLAPNTVKKYVGILESLYVVFLVRPFHKRIERAILREPKVYFYDTGFVKGDEGRRLENTCAHALLKHAHYLRDVKGRSVELHYLRTKEGREIDFALAEDDKPVLLAEIKLGEDAPSPHFAHFRSRGVDAPAVQVVGTLRRESRRDGVAVVRAADWLSGLDA